MTAFNILGLSKKVNLFGLFLALPPPVKALVTGATGFIGSHLAELLSSRGTFVRCLVRSTSNTRWLNHLPVEYADGDLFNAQALRDAVAGVDVIYHSAGLTKAKTAEEYIRANATGTRNLLEAAAAHNPGLRRFVHVSSQAAAGPSPTRTPITEEAPARPITSYGRSKWMAEQECHRLMNALPVTIVRPPAVYGPRDQDVFAFFQTMGRGLQPMVGLRDTYVSLIHVLDLVRGFVLAGESPKTVGQTYFITSNEVYNWKQIGEITRRVMDVRAISLRIPKAAVYGIAAVAQALASFGEKPALLNVEKARDMVQDYWTCDHRKALRDFGYEQEIGIEEGIRSTVTWYADQGWL
jgi:nucleoside-diphosphate-sugar epimerase